MDKYYRKRKEKGRERKLRSVNGCMYAWGHVATVELVRVRFMATVMHGQRLRAGS